MHGRHTALTELAKPVDMPCLCCNTQRTLLGQLGESQAKSKQLGGSMQVAQFLDAEHKHWAKALMPHLIPLQKSDKALARLQASRESDGDSDGEPYSPVATLEAAPVPFADEPSAKRRCDRLRGRRPATPLEVWRALFQKLPEAFMYSALSEQKAGQWNFYELPYLHRALAVTPQVLLCAALQYTVQHCVALCCNVLYFAALELCCA